VRVELAANEEKRPERERETDKDKQQQQQQQQHWGSGFGQSDFSVRAGSSGEKRKLASVGRGGPEPATGAGPWAAAAAREKSHQAGQ